MTTARNALLGGAKVRSKVVVIPELSTSVEVCGITAGAKGRLMDSARNEDGVLIFERYYPQLVVETARDPETHELLFTAADIDALNALPGSVISVLVEAAEEMSGLGAAIEVLEKNSAATESVATDSVSPNA